MKKCEENRIRKYREKAIMQMANDIEYFEKNGIDGDDLWEGIVLQQYSCYSTEEDKIRAFELAGYTVEF